MSERTSTDFAIEFAEYLAKGAEQFIEAVNALAMAEEALENDAGEGLEAKVSEAREVCTEHLAGLRNDIHQFRSRRDRAAREKQEILGRQQAEVPQLVAVAGATPGTWFVRKRERDGELLDCFVAAPDCQGMAYDAEILGDDEYREESGGVARKLADCTLIVQAVNAYRTVRQQPQGSTATFGALMAKTAECNKLKQALELACSLLTDEQAAAVAAAMPS